MDGRVDGSWMSGWISLRMDGRMDGWILDEWMDRWMDKSKDGRTDGWMDGSWMSGRMDGWMDGWMGGWKEAVDAGQFHGYKSVMAAVLRQTSNWFRGCTQKSRRKSCQDCKFIDGLGDKTSTTTTTKMPLCLYFSLARFSKLIFQILE